MGKSKSVLVSREQMDILEAAVNRITKMQMPQGWFIAHADELTTDYDWIPSQAAYLMKNIPVEPAAQSRLRVKLVCATCGSEDVLADAYVAWDTIKQKHVIHNVFDKGSYCQSCDGECTIESKPTI